MTTNTWLLLGAAGLAVGAVIYWRQSAPRTPSVAAQLGPSRPVGLSGMLFDSTTSNPLVAAGAGRCGYAGELPGKGVRCCNGFNPETGRCA